MRVFILLSTLLLPGPALASCGGDFQTFLSDVVTEATAHGVDPAAAKSTLAGARRSQNVLKRDRSQSAFRQSFLQFSSRAVSADRLRRGAQMRDRFAETFARVEADYGIPAEVILAFWAMETDYGAVMGKVHTLSALATLAHDCRRPDLFRPQLIAAIQLVAQGDLDVDETGAWAGEIGHVQMLPSDILELGQDGDGDGKVRIKSSAPDAILTAAAMLKRHGWRPGAPWLLEVSVPEGFDWTQSGLDKTKSVSVWADLGVTPRHARAAPDLNAALVAPQGHLGPKFLVFHNFTQVYLEWNKSLVNTLTAGYLATRLGGAPKYEKGNPPPILEPRRMIALQETLQSMGHDVGKIDGILGARTRAAVRLEQARLGIIPDGWPTKELTRALKR